ncbi:hypothetical protein QW131_21980 [Roseibium salinum]|nr:hypothetical protein [Roseibium salinum]
MAAFSTSATRFVPQYLQARDYERLRGFMRAARWTAFLIGAAAAAAASAVIYLLGPVIEPYYVAPLLIALLALPFFAFALIQDGIARSYDWSSLAMLPTYIWRPLAILVLLVAVALAGGQTDARTTAAVAVAATMIVALYQYVHLSRRLAPQIPAGPYRIEMTSWLAVSMPMLLVEGFLQLITSADVIMVSFFSGTRMRSRSISPPPRRWRSSTSSILPFGPLRPTGSQASPTAGMKPDLPITCAG